MKYSLSFRLKSYVIFFFDKIIGIYNVKTIIRIKAAYKIYKQVNTAKYRDDNADTIVWLYYPNYSIFKEQIVWDILLMAYVAKSKQKFQVYRKADIGKFHNKTILFNIHKDKVNLFGLEDYSAGYQLICKKLEEQGNRVFPKYDNVVYWENKIYMYERFKELNIHTPRTTFYNDFEKVMSEETIYPFLIKVPHSSGSYGIFTITDKESIEKIKNDPIITSNKFYIVQERLNISMDMRVILVGEEIVHYYWRKNNDKTKWRTTSTGNGSSVDFETFPEQWRQYMIDSFKRLGLITGGFDVGWQNDDVATEPYFFEVSPSYDVNPKTDNKAYLSNYGNYKKKLLMKNSFDKIFVEQTYDIKSKSIELFFDQAARERKQQLR